MNTKKRGNYAFWLFLVLLSVILAVSVYLGRRGPQKVVHPEWQTDFEAAKQRASDQQKDLLINFAGSDWCYWCKRLDAEVMTDADFVVPAQESFIFVLIDFPADRSGQSQPLQEQNESLAEEFAVQGYPTVILADSKGIAYARTGYRQGGGKAYLEHIRQLQSKKQQPAGL